MTRLGKRTGIRAMILFLALSLLLFPSLGAAADGDVEVQALGNIEGFVYETNGTTPIAGATVSALDPTTGEPVTSGTTSTYEDGSYFLRISTGSYVVKANAPGHIAEYYSEASSLAQATAVTLTTSGLTGINFTLAPGGSIPGTVRNQWGGTEQNQIVVAWPAAGGDPVGWTFSDGSGNYTLSGLPYADYKISAGGPLLPGVADPGPRNASLMRGWWASNTSTVNTPDQATIITINQPNPITPRNFNLLQGGSLNGYVEGEMGQAISNATVILEELATGETVQIMTNLTGNFDFQALSPGKYILYASKPNRVTNYWNGNWGGAYTKEEAQPIQVNAGQHAGWFGLRLVPAGSISGTVFQADGTTPISGATVTVNTASTGGGGGTYFSKSVTTGGDGTYSMPGVPAGNYTASAVAYGYAIEYYSSSGGTADPTQATPFAVEAGFNTPDINFSLDPGGTISGTVSTGDTPPVPLVGAVVAAIPVEGQSKGFKAVTDDSGAYTIVGLPFSDDGYKLLATGGMGNPQYARQWYDGANVSANATPVPVGAQDPHVVDKNFQLPLGGSISGSITKAEDGQPAQNAWVEVYDYETREGITRQSTYPDGSYVVQGLATGTYTVAGFANDMARQYYKSPDNTYSWDDADEVSVVAPNDTPNINFSLGPGGGIQGDVRGPLPQGGDGPLPGVLVMAFWLGEAQPQAGAASAMDEALAIFYTRTGSDGTYRFESLPFGDYRVRAGGEEDSWWVPRWFNGRATWDEAETITIDEFNRWPGAWFWLPPGGQVTGYVYEEDGTTPIAGADVFAMRPPYQPFAAYSPGEEILSGTNTREDGSYVLIVPEGTAIIGARAAGHVRKFFDDAFDSKEATPLEIIAKTEYGGKNFSLELGGSIAGRVTDSTGTTGLSECQVSAINAVTGTSFFATTDTNGNYLIESVPYGSYIVSARGSQPGGPTPDYALEFYNNTPDMEQATPVEVGAQNPNRTSINFTLAQGGRISGRISETPGGGGIWDATVTLYDANDHAIMQTKTEGDGSYRFYGVPAGDYRVSAWKKEFNRRYYNNKTSLAAADPVTVTPPSEASGKDIALPRANGKISGNITYSGSVPNPSTKPVYVMAVPSDDSTPQEQSYVSPPLTGAFPRYYELQNVSDGSYYLFAWMDVDGSGPNKPGDNEPFGFHGTPTAVVVSGLWVTGKSIALSDTRTGIVTGHVTVQGRTDPTAATVTIGETIIHPDASGNFTQSVPMGIYNVTVSLNGYLTATKSGVEVGDLFSGGGPADLGPVTLLGGDADASGTIDVTDLAAIASAFGTAGPSGNINGDGLVDVFDLVLSGLNYGKNNSPWP